MIAQNATTHSLKMVSLNDVQNFRLQDLIKVGRVDSEGKPAYF